MASQSENASTGHARTYTSIDTQMGGQVKMDGWMEQGFTSHSTQNKSFWRRSYQPIFFLGVVLKKLKSTKLT